MFGLYSDRELQANALADMVAEEKVSGVAAWS